MCSATSTVSGAEEVKQNWDAIKAAERAEAAGGAPARRSTAVPFGQPALSLAAQLQRRAERAGAPAAALAGLACRAWTCRRAIPPPPAKETGTPGTPRARSPEVTPRPGPGRQRHRRRAVRAGGQGP